jgi:MoxR-like ATPase
MSDWRIFTGEKNSTGTTSFPPPPPWRVPGAARERVLASTFRPTAELIDAVNASIYLRRPLLITGKPGSGKSSLIYAVASELNLGSVLTWPINSRSALRDALYSYDALGRLQRIQERQGLQGTRKKSAAKSNAAQQSGAKQSTDEGQEIGLFLTLGPLGTAVASGGRRALLVDEIDKSDVDLPNDLLNVLDTGHFKIDELRRLGRDPAAEAINVTDAEGRSVPVRNGEIAFTEFPFVVMTSNGERDFPAPFLRRCVQFELAEPTAVELRRIVRAHFPAMGEDDADLRDLKNPASPDGLLAKFIARRNEMPLSTDQLLNAVHVLRNAGSTFTPAEEDTLLKTLFQKLG